MTSSTSPSKSKEEFTNISVIGRQDGPKNIKLSLAIARYCHLKILQEQDERKELGLDD